MGPSTEVLEKRDGLAGHRVEVEGLGRIGRSAVAAPAEGGDAVVLGESRTDRSQHAGAATHATMQQHDRRGTLLSNLGPGGVSVEHHFGHGTMVLAIVPPPS